MNIELKVENLNSWWDFTENPDCLKSGIYFWTIPNKNKELIYYIGITTRTIAERTLEHLTEYLKGEYCILNLDELKKGNREYIWKGLWRLNKFKKKEKISELKYNKEKDKFFKNKTEQLRTIRLFLSGMNLYFFPFDMGKRELERIEKGIALNILEKGDPCIFNTPSIVSWKRTRKRDLSENKITIKILRNNFINLDSTILV